MPTCTVAKKTPQNIMAVYCLRGQMANFLANGCLELAWVKSLIPPCLLCMSLCLSESLGGKGLLNREWPVQALEMGNPKTNTMAKPLSSGLGFASPFGEEVSAFLGQAALTLACVASKSYKELLRWVIFLSARIKNEFRQEPASPLLLTEWQHQPQLLYTTQRL